MTLNANPFANNMGPLSKPGQVPTLQNVTPMSQPPMSVQPIQQINAQGQPITMGTPGNNPQQYPPVQQQPQPHTGGDIFTLSKALSEAMANQSKSLIAFLEELYKTIINNPDVMILKQKVESLEKEVADLKAELNEVKNKPAGMIQNPIVGQPQQPLGIFSAGVSQPQPTPNGLGGGLSQAGQPITAGVSQLQQPSAFPNATVGNIQQNANAAPQQDNIKVGTAISPITIGLNNGSLGASGTNPAGGISAIGTSNIGGGMPAIAPAIGAPNMTPNMGASATGGMPAFAPAVGVSNMTPNVGGTLNPNPIPIGSNPIGPIGQTGSNPINSLNMSNFK